MGMTPKDYPSYREIAFLLFGVAVLFIPLYLIGKNNYLLFHVVVEIFSVIIAFAIFLIFWHSRQFLSNNYFLIIGTSFLFVGALDFLHTLSYKGMDIILTGGSNIPTQLWISARFLKAASFFVAPFFINRRVREYPLFFTYLLVFVFLVVSIYYLKIFPTCYIEGVGLTPFKKISEYVVCVIFLFSIFSLIKKKSSFDSLTLSLLVGALFFSIISEISFTLYRNVYDIFNFVGHFFKIVAFYLIYRALIVNGLTRPYSIIFHELKKAELENRESREYYQNILESLHEGIWGIDKESKTNFVNNRMAEMLGYTIEEMMGKHLFDFMDKRGEKIAKGKIENRKGGIQEQHDFEFIKKDGTRIYALLETAPLVDHNGQYRGAIAGVQDITARKNLEQERERLIKSLQEALENVVTLSGLLPICAQCKKIRNDKGYWEQIEKFISEHSGAVFTHGICPECKENMMKEYHKK